MNSAVVLFLDQVDKVNRVIETGVTVSDDMFVSVLPLTQPATKVILSNVPPFITDEFLSRELSRHGKVSPDQKDPAGAAGRNFGASPHAKACRAAAVSVPVHRGDGHDRGRVILTVLGSGGTMVRLRSSFFVNSTPLMSLEDITRSMKDLESDIVELEEMSESTGDRGCIEILKVKKLALANLLESKVQGALVRSLFQNIAEMDTPSRLLLRPGEEKRTEEGNPRFVIWRLGQELVEPGQIRRRAVEFYCSLYSSEYEEDNTLQEEFCSGCLKFPQRPTPG
ncbi:hypothetical protein L3Q82_001465 [Scortum barcoo]|uniref:Uncharacterized protein n=1 Tax=Scortum barcoo TaxID=214431 RepID=A0ACB8WAN8_9TELE|nr:hypothetical protein L3Q82_001465 [Scortum barcoo]